MGINLRLVNFDKAFERIEGKSPTILNDVEAFTESEVERLNNLLTTTYSGDMLTNIPTCDCESISGNYNLGVLCTRCNTEVKQILGVDLQAVTWIRSPKGVDKLINPHVWLMLKKRFSIGNFNVIMWLADPSYRPPINEPPILRQIELMTVNGQQIQRGYNFFVQNFWAILRLLFDLKLNSKKRSSLYSVLERYEDRIFSSYLPMPHRSVLVIEDTYTGSYVDDLTPEAKDAILNMAGVDSSVHAYSTVVKEGRTARFIDKFSQFLENVYQKVIAPKEALIRKHVIATRSNWSFRAVITSITDNHDHEQIYIPWGVATSVFRTDVASKLLKLGYTPDEIVKFIDDHAERYSPVLDAIFKELIAEAPSGRGVAVSVNRNPSLQRGSILRCYIGRVKTEPTDNTVSLSILVVSSLNADFDGRHLPSLNFL